jgi:hypothetical protein
MTDDPANKHLPLPIRVAAAAIAAIGVIGTPAYFIGKMEGAGDLRAWERAGGERFKDLLDTMRTVSTDLKDRLRVYEEAERAKARVGDLEAQIRDLRRDTDARRVEAAEAVRRADELAAVLDEVRGKRRRFALAQGRSVELVPGVFVGLENLQRGSQTARLNLRNALVPVTAGSTHDIPNGSRTCTLAVVEIPSVFVQSVEVTFEFGCPPEQPTQTTGSAP